MAIYFKSSDPNQLLLTFKKAIDNGHIVTWSYDDEGDFTHTAEQWRGLAWLRPKIQENLLTLNIIKSKSRNISAEIYAIYHGRFLESMLVHCDSLFTEGYATALATKDDLVNDNPIS